MRLLSGVHDFLGFPFQTLHLVSPGNHSPSFTRLRATLIVGRVKQIALLFAFLTLCWVIVDVSLLPRLLWKNLLLARLVTAMAFISLARSCQAGIVMRSAYVRLVLLFAVPMTFLAWADRILHDVQADALSTIATSSYFYAPVILAAGVSFFPLTLMETALLLGAPITLAMSASALAFPLIYGSAIVVLPLLLLVLVTSSFAGTSQLGFMLALFEDAAHDALTGVFSRIVGEALLDQQFELARRHRQPLVLLFLDLDYFKQINDEFGHEAGDMALLSVASHLAKALRRQDIAMRWGGDEFVLVLPGTESWQAQAFLQRLAAEGLGAGPDGRRLTASIGVAESRADQCGNWKALVALADSRAYRAKNAGRNRYVVGEESFLFLP